MCMYNNTFITKFITIYYYSYLYNCYNFLFIIKMTQMTVQPCGMFVSKERPYLAGSPDGLVSSSHTVEVKCPYSATISAQTVSYLEDKDGKIQLSKSHKYFDQVQGQMYVTGRQQCYFVVYTLVDCAVIQVAYDSEYVTTSLLPKLELFYHRRFLPFICEQL